MAQAGVVELDLRQFPAKEAVRKALAQIGRFPHVSYRVRLPSGSAQEELAKKLPRIGRHGRVHLH